MLTFENTPDGWGRTIRKRDGRVVPFSIDKLNSAIERCAIGIDGVIGTWCAQAASIAERLVFARNDEPTVEQIQDAVEQALIAVARRDCAKAYMRYRDERTEARRQRAISPEVREAFRLGAEAMGDDPLRIFQFYDKYSRWNGVRRETWPECVSRALLFLRSLVTKQNAELPESVWAEIGAAMLAIDALPSMRLLAMAGPAADRDNVSIYNCSYQVIDSLDSFRESLLISMAGCGDGYSVEHQFVSQLPFVRYQRTGVKPDRLIIPDTSEGWGDSLFFGMSRWFEGHDAEFDFSELRTAGAILKTKGGRASGPKPLRDLLLFIRKLIMSRQGMQLRPIDVNDIMTMTGTAGNSGGMRRAAKLSLSDWLDEDMTHAKDGEFWRHSPWRSYANNSAVWPDGGPSQIEFIRQMQTMFAGRSGERGIFSRQNALHTMPSRRAEFLRAKGADRSIGTNPCGEIVLQNRQFCNLSLAVARPSDDMASLLQKVRVATILGTIQSTATHFPNLRPDWKQNCEEERLLGVDVTGQMDCPIVRDQSVLRILREEARRTNTVYAKILGIVESAGITCNKPSGNSSAFINCAPGIHGRKIRYGIRNARVNAKSPVYRALRSSGVPMDPENGQLPETADTWVVHFPMAAPEGSVIAKEQSAIAQLEHWKLNKIHYTEHNPSCTIEYGEGELIDVISWVWENRQIIGGLSFLPRDNSVYRQMPYEETSREEYERARMAFPKIDWSLIVAFEMEDQTTQAQELSCTSGNCET